MRLPINIQLQFRVITFTEKVFCKGLLLFFPVAYILTLIFLKVLCEKSRFLLSISYVGMEEEWADP